jgi:hypothetical protein
MCRSKYKLEETDRPSKRPTQAPRACVATIYCTATMANRGLPRSQPRPTSRMDFDSTLQDTLRALSDHSCVVSSSNLGQHCLPPGPALIPILDRAGYLPMPKPLVPYTRRHPLQLPIYDAPHAPVPQHVLDARISPYSILRHSPRVALQPTADQRWSR